MNECAQTIIEQLTRYHETICTSESCTGGSVVQKLASVSGASAVLMGGLVAYAPRIKVEMLTVDPALVTEETIVSCATAVAMATGARARFGTDWAIATTGFAGPGGGNTRYAVGTVCIAIVSTKHGVYFSQALHLHGSRLDVMNEASDFALAHLLSLFSEAERKSYLPKIQTFEKLT